jgi:uncharacterized protein YgbK (DUF1537 family)
MDSDLLLAAIADDYTGGSDMAGMLAGEGVRTVQMFGVPDESAMAAASDAEAIVVSLKTRSIVAADAVRLSLDVLTHLRRLGPRQVQFKYCSTFDSTRRGNIGPVTAALMDAMQADFTIAVPALPVNGRTQYYGHLFVNGVPLSESHMRTHPLNPMTDSNLVRHLQLQTERRVGLVNLHDLRNGSCERPSGADIALVDAIEESDLLRIASEFDLRLLTGGSGISKALPAVWRKRFGWSPEPFPSRQRDRHSSKALLLAGSCSAATLGQIEEWRKSGGTMMRMNVNALDRSETDRLGGFCLDAWRSEDAVLVYSSEPAEQRRGVPEAIETAFGSLARALAGHYGRLIVAGGETAGAVVDALGIRAVEIGPAIDPGVPALRTLSGPPLAVALKSGNFGAIDFFRKALRSGSGT